MVARLRSTWPTVAEAVVEVTIRLSAYSFRRTGMSAYVAILIERRARKVLGSVADGPSPGHDHDDGERK